MRRNVWWHVALLTVGAFLLLWITPALGFHSRRSAGGWGTALYAALLWMPGDLFRFLPVLVGIAVGTAGLLGRRGVRTAAGVVLAAMVAMAVINAWVEPHVDSAASVAARRAPATWPLPSDTLEESVWQVSSLRAGIALLRGDITGTGEIRRTYPMDHPRGVAAQTIVDISTFLLPFITVGVMLGIVAWVRGRVTFRRARDEVVGRWVAAWIMAPVVWNFVLEHSNDTQFRMLFRAAPLWSPLVPYVPFLLDRRARLAGGLAIFGRYGSAPPVAGAGRAGSARGVGSVSHECPGAGRTGRVDTALHAASARHRPRLRERTGRGGGHSAGCLDRRLEAGRCPPGRSVPGRVAVPGRSEHGQGAAASSSPTAEAARAVERVAASRGRRNRCTGHRG